MGLLVESQEARPDELVLTGLVDLGSTRMALVRGEPSGVLFTLTQGIPVDVLLLVDLSAKNRWVLIRDGQTMTRLTFPTIGPMPAAAPPSRQATARNIGELRRLIREASDEETRDFLKKKLEFHAADPIDAPK